MGCNKSESNRKRFSIQAKKSNDNKKSAIKFDFNFKIKLSILTKKRRYEV